MATPQSPFFVLENLAQSVMARFPPPPWAVQEVQRRMVLLLNHVLMQEPAATSRLARRKGAVVLVQWRNFYIRLLVTPAGLLDLAQPDARPDLSLTATDASVATIAQSLLQGDKPAIRIEGDVQLAGDVNWLVDHVRWDLEEDVSRVIGDAPAHALGEAARRMAQVLRQFATKASAAPPAPPGGGQP
jgi:ubiquinone biosynthesis accessory factor UbiJ